jgi:hypothetical protein
MLSNPYPESSTGSQSPGFTSTASRSRIALLYSARFNRCTGARPGFGLAAADASSVASRNAANAALASGWGRVRTLGGGISPERTLRRTFSQTSACAGTSVRLRF